VPLFSLYASLFDFRLIVVMSVENQTPGNTFHGSTGVWGWGRDTACVQPVIFAAKSSMNDMNFAGMKKHKNLKEIRKNFGSEMDGHRFCGKNQRFSFGILN
jgi:hypothetical protein